MSKPFIYYNIKTSRKRVIEENASKYLFFAWTLNRLKEFLVCEDAVRINEYYITKSIHKTELLKGIKDPDKLVDKWLVDMEFIGLIKIVFDPKIRQTLIYITEAQESRRLSKTAIFIAIVSVLVAISAGIISFMIN